MSQTRIRLIVAENDRLVRESICMGFGPDFEIYQAASGSEVQELVRTHDIDAAVLDIDLDRPSGDVIQVCRAVQTIRRGVPLPMFVAGDRDDADLLRRIRENSILYVLKPVHIGILSEWIRVAIKYAARIMYDYSPGEHASIDSSLFRVFPLATMLVDRDGKVVMVNEAFERLYASRSFVISRNVGDFIAFSDAGSREDAPFPARLACESRGSVPVIVQRSCMHDGPWIGTSVYFITESQSLVKIPDKPEPAPAARAKILVLEDYELVSRSFKLLLEKAGHDVCVVGSADAAMTACSEAERAGAPFDLSILDLSVPGSAGGADVLRNLRNVSPGIRAIVTSGEWSDPTMQRPADFGFCAALQKPFTRNALMEVVDKTLSGRCNTTK